MKREGQCYKRAFLFLRSLRDQISLTPYWVQGTIVGFSGDLKGVSYGHAWVECGDVVFDPSNHFPKTFREVWPQNKNEYYKLHSIDLSSIKRFTYDQVDELGRNKGHFGPY